MTKIWASNRNNGVVFEEATHFLEIPFLKRGFFSRLLEKIGIRYPKSDSYPESFFGYLQNMLDKTETHLLVCNLYGKPRQKKQQNDRGKSIAYFSKYAHDKKLENCVTVSGIIEFTN